jgi:hypothetical protein
MKKRLLLISILLVFAGGCSKEYTWNNPLDPGNNQAPVLSTYDPPDSAQSIYYAGGLHVWATVFEANSNDSIHYDFYFGTVYPPPCIGNNINATYTSEDDKWICGRGFSILEGSTLYYWKVIVYDNHGAKASSPILSFSTRDSLSN